ncbi:MAG: hypothetical protein AB1726_11180 [Planctomycetota bacterium]
MLRFQMAVSAGLATILVVPAILLGGDEVRTLETALADTTRALEILGGIRQQFEAGQGASSGVVVAVTEAPILDARQRDERLVTLRNEVDLLQTELDLLEGAAFAGPPVPEEGALAAAEIAPPAGPPLPRVHTGLDDALRHVLAGPEAPAGPATEAAADTPRAAPGPAASAGEPAYSADPLRQARACYRAGRHEEGAALLAGATDDPETLYWRARCLERLDRLDEAAADLRRVIELAGEGLAGQRARTDLEFVEWKRGFLAKLAGGKEKR